MRENMKIIIEGPNNVGKTSLINYLLNKPEFENFTRFHLDNTTPNDFEYHNQLLDMNASIIFDRFHIGEYVYPRVFDRDAKMTTQECFEISERIKDENHFLIILTADDELVKHANICKGEKFNKDETGSERFGFFNFHTKQKAEGIISGNIRYFKNELGNHEEIFEHIYNVIIDYNNRLELEGEMSDENSSFELE